MNIASVLPKREITRGADISESTGCTPAGLLKERVSAMRRPPVRTACISGHLGILATKYSLDSGLAGIALSLSTLFMHDAG